MNILVLSTESEIESSFLSKHLNYWEKHGHFLRCFKGFKFQLLNSFWVLIWYLLQKDKKWDIVVWYFQPLAILQTLVVKEKKLIFIDRIDSGILSSWIARLNILIERVTGSNFMYVAGSSQLLKKLRTFRIDAQKLKLLEIGYSPRKYRVGSAKDKILVFDLDANYKGVESALTVFSLLLRRDPEWRMSVVGNNTADNNSIVCLISKSEHSDRVRLIRGEERTMKVLRKSLSYLIISPVRNILPYLLRAGNFENLIFSYNISPVNLYLKNQKNAILINRGDTYHMAEKILEVCQDVKTIEKTIKNLRVFVSGYSEAAVLTKSLKIIEQI